MAIELSVALKPLGLALALLWLAVDSGAAGAQSKSDSATAERRVRESPVRRGSIQIGGTAAFTHSRDIANDYGWTTLELMPRAGYFVARGLAVSLNLRQRHVWYDDQPTVRDQTFRDWGIGPGLTYFASTKFPRVFPFVAARTLFSRSLNQADIYESPQSQEPSIDDREARASSRNWQLAAGVMYMVVKHVGISGEAFYQRTRATVQPDTPEEASNTAELYGLQWGLAAFIF